MSQSQSNNKRPHLAFTDEWFEKNQRILLRLSNGIPGKVFRRVLCVHKDIPPGRQIKKVAPNHIVYTGEKPNELTADFRTHAKFGKRIYKVLMPVWWAIHAWDWTIADRFIPQLSYGFSTLTAYPDPHPESSSVDGYCEDLTTNMTWANKVAAAGSSANDSATTMTLVQITADGGNANKWEMLSRGVALFDTSSLGSSASISAATLSFYGSFKTDDTGITANINIYAPAPASNTAVASGDFDSFGTTELSTTMAYSSFSDSAYNDFALNASGISNISLTGVSKFGTRNANYDVANSSPTYNAAANCRLRAVAADNSGTSQDPKLVITYTTPTAWTKTISETTTTTTSMTRSTTKVLSDTASATASFIKTCARTISNTIATSTSGTSAIRTVIKTLLDSVTTTESVIRSVTKTISNTITSTASALKTPGKVLSNTTTTTTAIVRTITKVLSSTITMTGGLGQLFIYLNGVIQDILWRKQTKNSSSWTNGTKNTSTWTNQNKS